MPTLSVRARPGACLPAIFTSPRLVPSPIAHGLLGHLTSSDVYPDPAHRQALGQDRQDPASLSRVALSGAAAGATCAMLETPVSYFRRDLER